MASSTKRRWASPEWGILMAIFSANQIEQPLRRPPYPHGQFLCPIDIRRTQKQGPEAQLWFCLRFRLHP